MNKKLKKFVKKCGIEGYIAREVRDYGYTEEAMTRFAEMIVNDLLKQVTKYYLKYPDNSVDAMVAGITDTIQDRYTLDKRD